MKQPDTWPKKFNLLWK